MQLIKCSKCKELKEQSFFSKSSDKKNGLQNLCKQCVSMLKSEYYQKNKSKYLKQNAEYYQKNKSKNLGRMREANRNWIMLLPDYYVTHQLIKKSLLSNWERLAPSMIPAELIEIKRLQLTLHRAIIKQMSIQQNRWKNENNTHQERASIKAGGIQVQTNRSRLCKGEVESSQARK